MTSQAYTSGIYPGLIRLLFNGLLLATLLSAQAQTTWTNRPQTADQLLTDAAFGAGRYVVVGGDGAGEYIQTSTDGIGWSTQFTDHPNSGGLFALVYAAGKFVAVGAQGRVLTSPDGLSWTPQVSGTGKSLNDIAYGAGQFIAVGDNGTLITSADAVTWSPQVSGTPQHILVAAYGAGLFLVAGHDGMIKTSTDGVTWINRQSGIASTLRSMTAGPNGLLVAVGNNGAIVTSPDGVTWTLRPGPGALLDLSGVACNPTTGAFVAVARAKNQVLTSPDGIQWGAFPFKSGTEFFLYGVRFLNGQFIATGAGGTIRTSTNNGISWHPLTIDSDLQLRGAAYGNGRYVAVGKYPISISPAIGSAAITSTNGVNYVLGSPQHFAGADEGFNNVVFGNGQFVAVGGEGIIQTSPDGLVWTMRYSGLGATIRAIAYGNGQYVAVGAGFGPGSNGNILQSTDGISWSKSSTGSTFYSDISYANGQFVAVGLNGAIGTSPDGSNWTPRSAGIPDNLSYVAYGNGTYIAIGIGSGFGTTVTRSTDGVSWTVAPAFKSDGVASGLTFGNGQFVALVQGGRIFTSPDGLTWTPRMSNTQSNLEGITYGNGLFVAVGYNATVVTSPNDAVVQPGNLPPVAPGIGNASGVVGQPFLQTIPAFTDPEGLPLTYSISSLPAGLQFTAGSAGTISGIPTGTGVTDITVTATDQSGMTATATFTITINSPGGNQALQLVAPSYNCSTGQFTFNTTGGDGSQPEFMAIGITAWTTNPNQFVDAELRTAADAPLISLKARQNGQEVTYSWNIRATCPIGNAKPPVFNGPLANQTVLPGSNVLITLPSGTFTDPENQVLTVTAAGQPAGFTFDGSLLSGVAPESGAFLITLTATDTDGLATTGQFMLTVSSGGGSDLQLVAPTYNCATGQFTFNTTGGDGSQPEFMAIGITAWTTNPNQFVDAELRTAADAPLISLKARQNGQEVTYSWNIRATCPVNGSPRQSAELEANLITHVYPNPVDADLTVLIEGASHQTVDLWLMNLSGSNVLNKRVKVTSSRHQEVLNLEQQAPGVYLLRVTTHNQQQTVKVIKR
ncbi:T9SS type A sorting domain-containing protein [Spirosoma aureum]|uniref:T9SS type A sorting domain-containing protein n=1 Tax=Spirosoma aureum TaxID=2692134 RepID=A0A6G9AKS2_9BACT|nr:putative Ig domain-containing protein [Spirosoma aureum]QIP13057.1 T9SS type A sorting domain-containing protein [Spirosoma aureum]